MARSLALGVSLLVGVIAPGALAGVIQVSVSQPISNSHGSTSPVELPKFDPSFGTLQSIDFIFEVGYAGLSRGENTAVKSANKYATRLDYSISMFAPDAVMLVSRAASFVQTGVLSAFDGAIDYAGSSGYSTPFSDGNSAVWSSMDLAVLSQHTGLGTVSYSAGAGAQSQFDGGIGVVQNYLTSSYAKITASYTYVEVPAPASLALGVLGLASLRRRR